MRVRIGFSKTRQNRGMPCFAALHLVSADAELEVWRASHAFHTEDATRLHLLGAFGPDIAAAPLERTS